MLQSASDMIHVGGIKFAIEEFFWQKVFDRIGSTYKSYDDAASKSLGRTASFKDVRTQRNLINIDNLKNDPKYKNFITEKESFFDTLSEHLEIDHSNFNEKVNSIFEDAATSDNDAFGIGTIGDHPYERIQEAYKKTLDKWIEARNELNDERFKFVFGSNKKDSTLAQAEVILDLLKRSHVIKFWNIFVEIVAPIAAGLIALIVLWN